MKNSENKPKFRYRVHFTKIGTARFIGHLDLQSLFQKAIKRSGLPVSYSEGFNPHQLISFAAPLPLGMAGLDEIVDIFMDAQVCHNALLDKLTAQMPEGISIHRVYEISPTGKGAAALVSLATYRITLPIYSDLYCRLVKAVDKILQAPSITVVKNTKKGRSEVDIRSDIHSLTCTTFDDYIEVLAGLSTGSQRNLKPSLLMTYILDTLSIDSKSIQIHYERKSLHLSEDAI